MIDNYFNADCIKTICNDPNVMIVLSVIIVYCVIIVLNDVDLLHIVFYNVIYYVIYNVVLQYMYLKLKFINNNTKFVYSHSCAETRCTCTQLLY